MHLAQPAFSRHGQHDGLIRIIIDAGQKQPRLLRMMDPQLDLLLALCHPFDVSITRDHAPPAQKRAKERFFSQRLQTGVDHALLLHRKAP